jgi:hypothetical protein
LADWPIDANCIAEKMAMYIIFSNILRGLRGIKTR